MTRRTGGAWLYRLGGLLLVSALGAVGGYMTSVRAGRPRGSMAVVGALLGAFVGFVVLLQVLPLSRNTKRLGGVIAGLVVAVACGLVMAWSDRTIVGVGLLAAFIGLFSEKWARSISI
jgi:hypothetical protein